MRRDLLSRGERESRRVSAREFREFMAMFPTGVAVVTTVDDLGAPLGMTCSSLASVTLEPPTLLVCLRSGGATLNAVLTSSVFAVNLLRDTGRAVAEVFCSPVSDRFGRVAWHRSPAGLPWISAGRLAAADCQVTGHVLVGDHVVVFGEPARDDREPGIPLLYGMRAFSVWSGEAAPGAR